jgi:glycolate oxidase FAD binding subunit
MPADIAGPAAGLRFDCPTLRGAACVSYAVQGRMPALVLLPHTEQMAAASLAVCDAHGLAVTPWGGGALQAVGNTPARLDAVLSLEYLNRVVSYEPGDLTIAVQAGVTLTKLQDTLGTHGQMLPFDVPASPHATVGGAVATNLAGPRRFGPGSFRDLLIGLTVAAPDGTISKAGGMVVKNVSGYDMMKLHLGALGTLGLLLRLNFKVLTRPTFDGTAVIAGDRGSLLELAATLANSQLMLDSLELFGPGAPSADDRGWRLAARLTGSEQGVARKRGEVAALCAEAGLTPVWTQGQAMLAAWQRCADFLAPGTVADDEALLRLSAPPAQLGEIIDRLESETRATPLHLRLAAHAGNGVVFARLRGPRLATLLPSLLATLGTGGSSAVLLAAPPDVKRDLDVWGPLPDSFPLMQRIKAEFDPRNTLNPGRFLGHL